MKRILLITTAIITAVSLCYTSYQFGFANGTENGYSEGQKKGLTYKAQTEYSRGLEEGIKLGNEEGFQNGNKQGEESGYEKGFEQGYQKGKEEIPDGYIKLTKCIPLQDISCTWINEYDYICVEIGDYGKQLDDPNNASYESVLAEIPDVTEEYRSNMVNMSEVVDIKTTETGIYFYMENGEYYYWER